MAKLKGLSKLEFSLRKSTEDKFKKDVKTIVQKVNNLKSKLINAQRAKLMNKSIFDGKTDYPHFRTGNMLRNLIDIKIDSFSEGRFKKTNNKLTYSFTATNMLDGGSESQATVFKTYKGKRYNYAKILQYSGRFSKYNGYFERLQNVFRLNYIAKVRAVIKQYL